MRRSLPADVYDILTTAYQHIEWDVIAQGVAEVQSRYDREPTEPPATVCVRLDGLADRIAATLREADQQAREWGADFNPTSSIYADAIYVLLRSLAVS
jgi:hypothetical protein